MGSSMGDLGYAIAVDENGYIYVAGNSVNTWGNPVSAHSTGLNQDAFAAKLNSSGDTVWNTFMGSSEDDDGFAIAVDESGFVYVAGSSETVWGSHSSYHAGGSSDAFAAKLNSSGVRQWNTFLGSSETDYGKAITVGGYGNVYVAGSSETSWGSPKNGYEGDRDAFAAKLSNSGVLQWNTFMGSLASDEGNAIAVDDSENVYVSGYSWATWGNPLNDHAGLTDAFAAKLTSSGETVWNTFMGSSAGDNGNAIAVDGKGSIYVAGSSSLSWGNPLNDFSGGGDAFAAKLTSSGETAWHTFMGSSVSDIAYAITVDGNGNVYVAGNSRTTWGNPINEHAEGEVNSTDVFVAKILTGTLCPGIPLLLLGF